MPALTLQLLGTPQIFEDGEPVNGFITSKAQALFLYVATTQTLHTRGALAGLFWPDMPELNAKSNLRRTLPNLRKLVGSHLAISNQTMVFKRDKSYWLDVEEFTSAFGSISNQQLATMPLDKLAAQSALYRSEFLHGFQVQGLAEFEQWVLIQREHLRELAIRALTILASRYAENGAIEEGLVTTRKLLALEPWSEIAHYQQMMLLARSGNRAQALSQYNICRTLLMEEFDAEPSAQMQLQYERIKSNGFDFAAPILPQPMSQDVIKLKRAPFASAELPAVPQVEWREIPRAGTFFNRKQETVHLLQLLRNERCTLVGLIGTGGTGKTVLAAHIVRLLATGADHASTESLSAPFEHIVWRSLINAPALETVIQGWLQSLLDEQPTQFPSNIDELLDLLFTILREKRCLLVLDNLETILKGGAQAGHFENSHKEYQALLQRMGETTHRSCLLLTSRELPMIVSQLERSHPMVRSYFLKGLDDKSGVQLLAAEGLPAELKELPSLVERYSGNPLALKLIAESVLELYGGNVAQFLQDRTLIFDDIRTVLEQQFNRLMPLEREILYWLAIEREPISIRTLLQNWPQRPPRGKFLEAVRSLQRRGLVERAVDDGGEVPLPGERLAPRLMLQNVIMEFVSDQLIEGLFHELIDRSIWEQATEDHALIHFTLNRCGLVKAQAKVYVREAQVRLLLQPLVRRLLEHFGRSYAANHLRRWLDYLRTQHPNLDGYAGANILHLLVHLEVDLSGWDFSHIYIRQADLRAETLVNVNFQNAALAESTFAHIIGTISTVRVSPDGRYLASSGSDGAICIWQTENYQLHCVLRGHIHAVHALCFSNDGRWLISGGIDGCIYVWEVDSGRWVQTITRQKKSIIAISLHSDNEQLAVALTDETIQVWNLPRAVLCHTLSTASTISDLAFSSDGKLLISVGDERQIHLWNATHYDAHTLLYGHEGKILAVTFNATGDLFATGGEDAQISLWDAATMRLLQTIPGHTDAVLALSFSASGNHLASGSADQTVRVWDLRTGKQHNILRGHFGWVNAVAFSADARTLISGGYDQTIRVWEMYSGQLLLAHKGQLKRVDFMKFSPDGHQLAASSLDGRIYIWDVATAKLRHLLKGPQAATRGLVFSRNGTRLATASDDHTVRLWDVRSGRQKMTLSGHASFVRSVVFSPDEQFLVSGSHDRTLRVWALPTGHLQRTIPNASATIQSAAAFHPIHPHLAYGTFDHMLNVIQIQSGEILHEFSVAPTTVTVVAFDPSGRWLACGTRDGHVLVYDLAAGKPENALLHRVHATQSPIWRLSFGPNGEWLAWICAGQQLHLLNLKDSNVSHAMPTHYGAFCLGFSKDSSQLFTDGADNTLLVRSVVSGEILNTLRGHTAGLTSIEVSPNGELVASSSSDGTMRVWDANTGACLAVYQFHGPYAGMNITGVTGISETQRRALLELGAIDEDTE